MTDKFKEILHEIRQRFAPGDNLHEHITDTEEDRNEWANDIADRIEAAALACVLAECGGSIIVSSTVIDSLIGSCGNYKINKTLHDNGDYEFTLIPVSDIHQRKLNLPAIDTGD